MAYRNYACCEENPGRNKGSLVVCGEVYLPNNPQFNPDSMVGAIIQCFTTARDGNEWSCQIQTVHQIKVAMEEYYIKERTL